MKYGLKSNENMKKTKELQNKNNPFSKTKNKKINKIFKFILPVEA